MDATNTRAAWKLTITAAGVRCLNVLDGGMRKLPLSAANWGTGAVCQCLSDGRLGWALDLSGCRTSDAGDYKVQVVHPKSYVHAKNYVNLFRWLSPRLQ